jgi:hypothetical protein
MLKRYWKKVLGVGLVILGLVALVTPLTPGSVVMIFMGLEFLGVKFLFLENLKNGVKDKFKRKERVSVTTDEDGPR